MGCKNCTSAKYTCGDRKQNAYCVYIDKTVLPTWSELKDEDCLVVYETIAELYDEMGNIKDSLKTTESFCLDYPVDENGNVLQSSINNVHAEEICVLKENVEMIGKTKGLFPFCELDYYDLLGDDCPIKPTTACEFYQTVLDKLHELTQKTKLNGFSGIK